jgi:hypothetical protein
VVRVSRQSKGAGYGCGGLGIDASDGGMLDMCSM